MSIFTIISDANSKLRIMYYVYSSAMLQVCFEHDLSHPSATGEDNDKMTQTALVIMLCYVIHICLQYHSNSVASCPGLTSFKKFDKSSSLLGRQMEAAHCARTTSVPSTTCACSFGCPCCSAGGSQYLRHHPACKMRHLLMPHQQVNSSPRDGGILSAYGYGLERPYTLYVHYQYHTT